MNFRRFVSTWGFCTLVGCFSLSSDAAERKIRLRNETISTVHPSPQRQTQRGSERLSGLYLVQFKGPLTESQRQTLVEQQVHLLRYVPEDSFIVRLSNKMATELSSLPFVHWSGPYHPFHKVHPRIKDLPAQPGPLTRSSVRILLAPGATASELAQVRSKIRRLGSESPLRQGTILHGEIDSSDLAALANSTATLWIEPAAKMRLFDEVAAKIVGGDDGIPGSFTLTQQLGFDGTGVTVAVADSGLQNGDAGSMHPDLFGRVDAFFHYGTLTNASDEHSHGTHVAGIVAGNAELGEVDAEGYLYGLGVAPGAHLVAQRIFDGEGEYHAPRTFEKLTSDAVRAGAEIGSNSWGDDTQGSYDLSAAEFDGLVRDADAGTAGDQPYILEFSAGNAGPLPQTIGSPAVAKNVIASGASQNNRLEFFLYAEGQEVMADFSSRGPCEDGRIKPDVVAPGTWIASLQSASATDENAWMPISPNYQYQGGTSQSGPQVSGAAAIFVQYYRFLHTNATPSPALVKAALINSAVDMDNTLDTTFTPNFDEGWGRVDLTRLIESELSLEMLDQSVLLTSGQFHERRILVASADQPLKITLAYTDVPGLPAAVPALVNDLDLEIEGPNGVLYRGNQFLNGESVENPGSTDQLNNVEGFYLSTPFPGEYIIRIRAVNVPEDARMDSPAPDQDFALVVSGPLALPGDSIVFLDRDFYRASDRMLVRVIDFDQAGQSSVPVQVMSGTETVPETITLLASGNLGVFTGTVFTATGSPSLDGALQVRHGDLIEARYLDQSASTTRLDQAQADLNPPLISNLGVSNSFGRVRMVWNTDEPARGIVYFATNGGIFSAVTNLAYTGTQSVLLAALESGLTYTYFIVSVDQAGNRATNNNGGAFYTFIPPTVPPVLLVDNFQDLLLDIPSTTYTEALDATGVGYQIWSVEDLGSPTAADLQPFRAVLWRVGEFGGTLSPSEQSAIRNYVTNGGAFFMASMEILSRLRESGASSFYRDIFQIESFIEDSPGAQGYESVLGLNNDPITKDVDLALDFTAYQELFNLNFSDVFTPSANALPIFHDGDFGEIAGLRYPAVGSNLRGRLVFLGFPLDTIPMAGATPNNRVEVLRRILYFLIPGLSGQAEIALDRSEYTIPSQVTMEITDPKRAGSGSVPVVYFREGETNRRVLQATETPSRGLFRGLLTLASTNSLPQPDELRVANGDRFRVEYRDLSNNVVTVSARVETVPPVISGIRSEPDYTESYIGWETSEPSDALVQFGESRFLGRTATRRTLAASHELLLNGLAPDRLYYYQVTSRDAAGNATVDDNEGELYTFRTLIPARAPWLDTLENSGSNWLTFASDDSQTRWELGTPNSSLATAAYSPTNAWGSNLNGQSVDAIDVSLISEPVALTAGNQAILRFRHVADFQMLNENEIYNFGSVHVSTNNGNTWIEIAIFEDEVIGGWAAEELDLSRFAGQVIRLAFYHAYFSLDVARPEPGWLIDNVAIDISQAPTGNLMISNNLHQGSFSVTGSQSFTGAGRSTLVTNLPAGSYQITFNPVAFYNTPARQTNTLASGALLTFTGNYSFADTNGNGISDEWDRFYFGNVTPLPGADSDGDGMHNSAEFASGTNPTNSQSALLLGAELSAGAWRFQWTAGVGVGYRLEGSTNLVLWTPLTDWIRAGRVNLSTNLNLPLRSPNYFRLQASP